ncbi:MAG: hypothetical protein EOO69_03805 [Moraxellaceae bacterium]|nr:MAG: hypothetical protein EOO69_03805 [Moraxellaceae bacterium]
MQFILKAFHEIEGIGAASGLIYQPPYLYLASDYSSCLYRYDLPQRQLTRIALFADCPELLPKPKKFDFEAIVLYDNALWLFGSGSTQRRNSAVCYDLASAQTNAHTTVVSPTIYDLSKLYEAFKRTAQLDDAELNIEGVIYHQAQWLFFQRGNGKQAKNGIFTMQGDIFQYENLESGVAGNVSDWLTFVPVQLPVIHQVNSSFTDAIVVGQTIYFLASAENSSSTYTDGEVLGSYLGCMDLNSKIIQDVQLISTCHKFEGLALYQQLNDKIEFLLCEDNDTEQLNTIIYKLSVALD